MITALKSVISPYKPISSTRKLASYVLIDLIFSSFLLMYVANWLILSFNLVFEIQYFQSFFIVCIVRLLFFNWVSVVTELHLIDIKMLIASEISRAIMKDKLVFELIKDTKDEPSNIE